MFHAGGAVLKIHKGRKFTFHFFAFCEINVILRILENQGRAALLAGLFQNRPPIFQIRAERKGVHPTF